MNASKVAVRSYGSNPRLAAVERLRVDALAEGETELARACEAALAGDPAALAAIDLALADDDDFEPCPATLPSGGAQ